MVDSTATPYSEVSTNQWGSCPFIQHAVRQSIHKGVWVLMANFRPNFYQINWTLFGSSTKWVWFRSLIDPVPITYHVYYHSGSAIRWRSTRWGRRWRLRPLSGFEVSINRATGSIYWVFIHHPKDHQPIAVWFVGTSSWFNHGVHVPDRASFQGVLHTETFRSEFQLFGFLCGSVLFR